MINFNVQIRDFPFDNTSQSKIEQWKNGDREYGTNWPVVYLLHNDDVKEAYIGIFVKLFIVYSAWNFDNCCYSK